jgi:IS5 family transposase
MRPSIGKFRRLLEAHGLGRPMLERINGYLAAQGFKVSRGTIVDATIINCAVLDQE